MYSATTHNVTVSVQPAFLDHESKPDNHLYLWSYTVRIENKSQQTLQLRTRYWEIIDGYGTPLPTSSGFMRGIYSMQTDSGEFIDITIPSFPLDIPGQRKPIH
jgi:ApaG protein